MAASYVVGDASMCMLEVVNYRGLQSLLGPLVKLANGTSSSEARVADASSLDLAQVAEDQPTHQLICSAFENLTNHPSPGRRSVFYFTPHVAKPELRWVPMEDTPTPIPGYPGFLVQDLSVLHARLLVGGAGQFCCSSYSAKIESFNPKLPPCAPREGKTASTTPLFECYRNGDYGLPIAPSVDGLLDGEDIGAIKARDRRARWWLHGPAMFAVLDKFSPQCGSVKLRDVMAADLSWLKEVMMGWQGQAYTGDTLLDQPTFSQMN
ncbi:hypothetical protein B0A48_07496 [Cryoendolithus antarcticus]|uniref:Uncharacterized protein n=1 Tax=Cryoendolithus antarcticus TaxID=1507870 RepID=A0A1V8T6F4_9PEZI|nr:hypothetical protein B0A48_07496 [Cryoendolithus antarcticus]